MPRIIFTLKFLGKIWQIWWVGKFVFNVSTNNLGHMETRLSSNRHGELGSELMAPVHKASGLYIHYNTATIYGYGPKWFYTYI